MGNVASINGGPAGAAPFAPSDGYFLIDAAKSPETVEAFQLFLNKNPALAWAVSQQDRTTPWHSAAQAGHLRALNLLANVSRTAAVSNTFNPTSKAVNQADIKGRTPLMLACLGGHYPCVELLLDLGADLFVLDLQGCTALHHAALAPNGHGGSIQLLLQRAGVWGQHGPAPSANPRLTMFVNAGDVPYGRSPLHLACWAGQVDGVVALLGAGARLDAKTSMDCYESGLPCNSGTTPLHLAAMRGHQPIIVMILSAYVTAVKRGRPCSDPRAALDAYGNTPYKIALSRKYDAPLMLQVLRPDSPIKDLQRLAEKRQRKQAQAQANGNDAGKQTEQTQGQPQLAGGKVVTPGAAGAKVPASKVGPAEGAAGRVSPKPVAEVGSVVKGQQGEGLPGAGGGQTEGSGPEAGRSKAQALGNHVHDATAARLSKVASLGAGTQEGSDCGSEGGSEDSEGSGEESDGSSTPGVTESDTSSAPQTPDRGSGGSVAPSKPISIRRMKQLVSLYSSARSALSGGGSAPVPPAPAQMLNRHSGGPALSGKPDSGTVVPAGVGPACPVFSHSTSVKARVEAYTRAVNDPPTSHQHTQLSEEPVPDFYLCPLTCRIFKDPVVASDGYSYERSAIERHTQSGSVMSPSTKKKLATIVLYPNHTLRSAVEHWTAAHKNQADDVG